MTWRSVLIGLVLVVVLCTMGYLLRFFAGIGLVSGGLPVAIFSTLVVLALFFNPVAARIGRHWILGGKELAVVAAMGLAVCAFTGSAYFRYLTGMTAMPNYAYQSQTAWQASQAMSYVPGYVGLVAQGQLLQPGELAKRVVGEKNADTAAGKLWRQTDPTEQHVWTDAAEHPDAESQYRRRLTMLVNHIISQPAFSPDPSADLQHRLIAARMELQQQMPDVFAPPPPGSGIMFNNGYYDSDLIGKLLFGNDQPNRSMFTLVPWGAWWPVIRTWGVLMVLLMTVAICAAMIVRPQWSSHEQLTFPIVKFAQLMIGSQAETGLPVIGRSPLFWIGFATVAVHIVNGLHEWFEAVPNIPMQLDLSGLRQLFPNISQFWQATGLLNPQISLTVIGFGFLLPRPISLTFGVANVLFLIVGAQLVAHGINPQGADNVSFDALINFGGMLGLAGFMLYTGRHYYRNVALSAVMLGPKTKGSKLPGVWAARVMVIALIAAVVHLGRCGGSMLFAALGIGLVLLLWLANARIVAETGLFRVGSSFMPVGVIGAFFGSQAVGPTQLIVLAMLGVLFVVELWETPMAYAVTGIELAQRSGMPAKTTGPGMWVVAMAGFVLTMVVTLSVQYQYGILGKDETVVFTRQTASMTVATEAGSKLTAANRLVDSVTATDMQRLAMFSPGKWAVGWTAAGLGLFVLCSIARLRWPWWSIHPILFVVFGNWGMVTFGASFLLSWLIKSAVVGTGGIGLYHRLVPLMCGLIAAGLLSAILWAGIGILYFLSTGTAPPVYTAF